jgi:type I restriction enzyme S subunit
MFLIAKVGDPPGVAAVYPDEEPDAIVTQDVIRIRLNRRIAEPEYVQCLLNSEYGKHLISSITVRGTRARFGLGQLKKTRLKILPIELQREFVRAAKLANSTRTRLAATLQQTVALGSSLSQRAFRGEL